MKIRNGFVSNSSSSSFCIVGVAIRSWKIEDRPKCIQILKEKILPEGKDLYDVYENTWGGETELEGNLTAHGYDSDIAYVGMACVDLWRKGASFKEVAEICRKTIKEKYKVDIPIDEFDIFFGETSSG